MQARFGRPAAALAALLGGCAPTIKDFEFVDGHPMREKRIGVVYSRSGSEGSEGVDDRDLRQFLSALGAGLNAHARHAEFVDLMGDAGLGPFPRSILLDTNLFGHVKQAAYAVPDSAALLELPAGLDCLLLISDLSFTGVAPSGDSASMAAKAAFDAMQAANRVADFTAGGVKKGFGAGMPTGEGADRGSADEATLFRYVVWDLRKGAPLAYSLARMVQDKDFGDETTTFAQDGERMGQVLLGKLAQPPKARPAAPSSGRSAEPAK